MKKIVLIVMYTSILAMTIMGCGKIKDQKIEYNESYSSNIKLTNDIIDDTKEKYKISSPELVKGVEYINTNKGMWFNKEIREHNDKEEIDGDYPIISHISSFIFLDSKTDITEEESDTTDSKKVNFEDIFGFDYKNYDNIFDIYYKILVNNGININFDEAVLNKDLYTLYMSNIYTITDDDEIIKNAIQDIDYDEIENTSVSYNVDKSQKTGVKYIDQVSIDVVYKKDNITYTRNINYSLSFGTPEQMKSVAMKTDSNCSCGSDADCNTGVNNGKGCESDCSMEEPIK